MATTAIMGVVFCESARAACPTGQIEDQTTGHCLLTDTDCGDDCRWTYDTTTKSITFQGTGMLANPGSNATNQGAAVGANLGYKKTLKDLGYTIEKVNIENGFSKIGDYFFTNANLSVASITIPSSVRSFSHATTWGAGIRMLICDSENINFQGALSLSGVGTLVINGSNNVKIPEAAKSYDTSSIKIMCRGNMDLCN